MGIEARCTAHCGGRSGEGKAHLETDELIFRGPFRLVIRLSELTGVSADGGRLRLDFADGPAVFELGDAAARWANRIANPPTLLDKLGIKSGQRVCLLRAPDDALEGPLAAAGVEVVRAPTPECDVILVGMDDRKQLAELTALRGCLKPAGAIWTLRPKGSPAIREADVMQAARDHALVDVKVARYSATHTAEKLVIPVVQRTRAGALPRA